MFSVDKNMFEIMAAKFAQLLPTLSDTIPRRRGRPAAMTSRTMLALALHYLSSVSPAKTLVMVFGVIPATLSKYLRMALKTLHEALTTIEQAAIRWPSFDEQRAAAELVRHRPDRKVPGDVNVLGFVDGTMLRIVEPPTYEEHALYYSGFHGCTCVSTLLVFLPDGTIPYARLDMPGITNDATAASHLLDKMRGPQTLPNMYLVGDGGFAAAHMADVMLAPLSRAADMKKYTVPQAEFLVAMSKWIRANRGCNEWANKDLKRAFPRIACGLPGDSNLRTCIVQCALHLYNMRVRMLPRTSEMRTVFTRELEQRIADEEAELNELCAAAERGEATRDDLADLLEVQPARAELATNEIHAGKRARGDSDA